jgi:hypothetical protein
VGGALVSAPLKGVPHMTQPTRCACPAFARESWPPKKHQLSCPEHPSRVSDGASPSIDGRAVVSAPCPAKRGHYVSIPSRGSAALYCVTGSRQRRMASLVLRECGIPSVPITRWDGSAWSETGTVLDAAWGVEVQA